MKSSDKLQIITTIIGIILIPLTALSIYFIYGSYLFSKWPWIRFSVVMSLLTCLWTYAFRFYCSIEERNDTPNTGLFGLIVIPCDSLLMYPSTALGINSDPYFYTLLIVLVVVHGLGFYLIQRGIQKYLIDSKSSQLKSSSK